MRLTFWILALQIGVSAQASLETDLKKTVSSYHIADERLGLYAVDLSKPNHPVVLSVNASKNFIPASLTKLMTAAVILQKLGPSYKTQTALLGANPHGEVLKGPLYLRGGGDPGFVSETMWLLVNDFYRTGVRKIEGDLIVDESAFDSVRFDESRDPERVDRAYDAPVGAMSFNWNAINIYIRPGDVGGPARVFLDPEMEGWKVVNHTKTTKAGKEDLRVSRLEDADVVDVSGKISGSVPEAVFYKAVRDPVTWSGAALKAFLKQRGILVTGTIKGGKTPSDAQVLAKVDGQPVRTLVIDMMKFSNNFVAEMLTKNLGAQFVKQPAELQDGTKVIRDTLVEIGLNKDNFQFVSPSGLSRHNSFRPADIVTILDQTYRRFSDAPEYLSALPLAGVDGTLRKRFKNSDAVGWVRAKTGHLHGVAGLAGYAGQKDGGVVAFAFIFNGPEDQGDLARRLFDALASELVQ